MPEHPDHDENISEANKKLRRGEKKETGKTGKVIAGRREGYALNPANDERKSEGD